MSVLVDTDALIAVANTSLWEDVKRVEMVTTNVSKRSFDGS
jgi:hypothetical protein